MEDLQEGRTDGLDLDLVELVRPSASDTDKGDDPTLSSTAWRRLLASGHRRHKLAREEVDGAAATAVGAAEIEGTSVPPRRSARLPGPRLPGPSVIEGMGEQLDFLPSPAPDPSVLAMRREGRKRRLPQSVAAPPRIDLDALVASLVVVPGICAFFPGS